jgi:hypothetical protein
MVETAATLMVHTYVIVLNHGKVKTAHIIIYADQILVQIRENVQKQEMIPTERINVHVNLVIKVKTALWTLMNALLTQLVYVYMEIAPIVLVRTTVHAKLDGQAKLVTKL